MFSKDWSSDFLHGLCLGLFPHRPQHSIVVVELAGLVQIAAVHAKEQTSGTKHTHSQTHTHTYMFEDPAASPEIKTKNVRN